MTKAEKAEKNNKELLEKLLRKMRSFGQPRNRG